MIGFRATDEDEDDAPGQVVDGHSCEHDPSPAELNAAFVSLCKELREMGCVEVRAGDFRAVWPAQPVAPAKLVQAAREKQKPKDEPLPEKVLDTDTPDDAHRRAEYIRIQKAIGGGA